MQPPGAPPGWGAPPPPPGYGAPAQAAPGWPQQGPAGDWSSPGYGNWAGGQKRNGMGTAALVLGIIAIPALITLVGGFVLGLLALIFGLVGRGRVKRREADNPGSATAGVVLGLLAMVAQVAIVIFFVVLASDAIDECVEDGFPRSYCEENFTID
jgi:hypothetical protein